MITGELSEAKIHVLPSPEMLVIQTGFILNKNILTGIYRKLFSAMAL